MRKKPLFIVLDSGEGAGKTTVLHEIGDEFGERLLFTREPGGTPYAEEIRKLILNSSNAGQADGETMICLYFASRADHLKNRIRPALRAGKNVLTDRLDSATYAYQCAQKKGKRDLKKMRDFFWKIREFVLGDTKPDHYIYLDIDPRIGLARKSGQGTEERNHFEERKIEFHDRVRKEFHEFLKHVPHTIIDASKSKEEVRKDVMACLERLGLKVRRKAR